MLSNYIEHTKKKEGGGGGGGLIIKYKNEG
jgi:hypothetical protein